MMGVVNVAASNRPQAGSYAAQPSKFLTTLNRWNRPGEPNYLRFFTNA